MKFDEIEPGMLLRDFGFVMSVEANDPLHAENIIYIDEDDPYWGSVCQYVDPARRFTERYPRGSKKYVTYVKNLILERSKCKTDAANDMEVMESYIYEED